MFIPKQEIEFLGFIICSKEMSIRLSHRKISQIKLKICTLLSQERVSIRELASIIGSLIATFPAITYYDGKLYYRKLEIRKIISLKSSKGNFEHKIALTFENT